MGFLFFRFPLLGLLWYWVAEELSHLCHIFGCLKII
jgi:hypothetical protein